VNVDVTASVLAEVVGPDVFEVLAAADAGGELAIMIETPALTNSNGVSRIVCQTAVGLSAAGVRGCRPRPAWGRGGERPAHHARWPRLR
jgi:hypothetical protein